MGSTSTAASLRLPIRHGRYRGLLAPEERAALLDSALADQAKLAPADSPLSVNGWINRPRGKPA